MTAIRRPASGTISGASKLDRTSFSKLPHQHVQDESSSSIYWHYLGRRAISSNRLSNLSIPSTSPLLSLSPPILVKYLCLHKYLHFRSGRCVPLQRTPTHVVPFRT